RERKGFIVLTGEIGTGKTTLLRTLLERLDDEHPVAYVHNSSLPWEGMLEYILHDWGVKTIGTSQAQRLVDLNEYLIEQHRLGRATEHRVQPWHPPRDQHALRSLPHQWLCRQQAEDRRPHGRERHRVSRGWRAAALEAPRPGPAHAEPPMGVGGPWRRGRARRRIARHDDLRRQQRGLAALIGRTP